MVVAYDPVRCYLLEKQAESFVLDSFNKVAKSGSMDELKGRLSPQHITDAEADEHLRLQLLAAEATYGALVRVTKNQCTLQKGDNTAGLESVQAQCLTNATFKKNVAKLNVHLVLDGQRNWKIFALRLL